MPAALPTDPLGLQALSLRADHAKTATTGVGAGPGAGHGVRAPARWIERGAAHHALHDQRTRFPQRLQVNGQSGFDQGTPLVPAHFSQSLAIALILSSSECAGQRAFPAAF